MSSHPEPSTASRGVENRSEVIGVDQAAGQRKSDLLGLFVAVVMASSAAGLMAAADAPALAIAFWRNGLAALVLLPMIWKHRAAILNLSRQQQSRMVLAGFFLGVHFACWVPSVKLTSIAAAASLVATQVVWAAVLAKLAGHAVPRQQAIGIAIALVGVITLTGIDVSLTPSAMAGDALALLGAMMAAAYMHQGQQVRTALPLSAFTAVVYAAASVTLLVVCVVGGQQLIGYSPKAWMYIVAVTAMAQFGGHTLFNRALRSFSATAVSIAILFQIPGGMLWGWAIIGQVPKAALLPAAALIAAGVVLVIRAERPASVDADALLD